MRALMRLRSGTNCASFRLAEAATIAVIGMKFQPP